MRVANASGMPVAFAAALALALVADVAGADLASAPASIAACVAILVTGLPHGTFDLALIRRRPVPGRVGRVATLAIYLAGAALMLVFWRTAPAAALAIFLAISVTHFAEDWPGIGTWPGSGIAAAVLAAPAILHWGDIRAIFAALAGERAAEDVASLMQFAAPVAGASALVAMAMLIRRGRMVDAAGGACAILAMLLLPPAIGFCLYFCLFHSPKHFRAALATLGWRWRQWMRVVVPLTAAAIAIVGALFDAQAGAEPSMRLIAATFMGLSVLTVPHMATPAIVRWVEARTGTRPVREGDQNPMMTSEAKVKLPLLRPAP